MHKTGSSSIQQNLERVTNAPGWRLLAVGGRPNMGPALHAMLRQDHHRCHWFAKSGESAQDVANKGAAWRQELREEIEKLTVENCIISAEALSTFSREGIVAFREFLAPLFDEIRVIGYVRPPVGFKTSRFQENVKHGVGEFNVADIRLNYRSKFKKFDDVFGRENVILRKFDPSTFPNHCTVADFCQQTGIVFPADVPIRRVNESLSREGCGILYAYRKFGPGYGVGKNVIKENLRLVKPLLAVRGAKFKVAMPVLEQALEQEQADIKWMEKRLGVSLKESVSADGSEVTCEQDLLNISRASCLEFVERFTEMYFEEVPAELIPEGDPVDPVKVAALVDHCRGTCRRLVESPLTRLQKRRRRRRLERKKAKPEKRLTPVQRFQAATMRILKQLLPGTAR